VEKAREERQGLLAEGKKIDAITTRIKAVREEQEILQDEIIGLEKKVEDLQKEDLTLLAKKSSLAAEIVKESLPPLVEDYNQKAQVLARALREIYLLHLEYGQSFTELGSPHIGVSSGFERNLNVRRLLSRGADFRQDIFNLRDIGAEVRSALDKKEKAREGQAFDHEAAVIEVIREMRGI
jgi:hypothetical protein